MSATAVETPQTQSFQNGKTFLLCEDNKDTNNNNNNNHNKSQEATANSQEATARAAPSNEASWKIFIVYQTICIN